MIYWSQFDWPSFAALVGAIVTLIVGIAAVRGAARVGISQVAIAKRQTDIQSRQVALAEASLRACLFERRLETYDAAIDYLPYVNETGTEGTLPPRAALFRRKANESRFLFRPEVHAALLEIVEVGDKVRLARNMLNECYMDATVPKKEYSDTVLDGLQWCYARMETLYEVFVPDLDLSAGLLNHIQGGDPD